MEFDGRVVENTALFLFGLSNLHWANGERPGFGAGPKGLKRKIRKVRLVKSCCRLAQNMADNGPVRSRVNYSLV